MLMLYSKLCSDWLLLGFAASGLQGVVRVGTVHCFQLLLRCLEYRQKWQPYFLKTVHQLQSIVFSQRHRQSSVHGLSCSVLAQISVCVAD
jgi:hypothetical protein